MALSGTVSGWGRDALGLIFPHRCLLCGGLVQSSGGLCPSCWAGTAFLAGLCCDGCGVPLIGPDPGSPIHCDACFDRQPPWSRGRAVLRYAGDGRKLVLALKHGDRTDLVPGMARWMEARAAPLLDKDTMIAPIPLHWRRLLARRYNQSALLARALAGRTGRDWCPDLLVRGRATPVLDGLDAETRHATLDGAIQPHRKNGRRAQGRAVLLIDDVMTSGATLTSATRACLDAGARRVDVMVLARVCRDA